MISSNKSFYELTSQRKIAQERLVQSINKDLNGLLHTIGEIQSWLGSIIDVNSYLFMQITNKGIQRIVSNNYCEYSKYQGTPEQLQNNYTTSLELIYDRLHVFINLLVEFLNISPPIAKEFSVTPDVTIPNYPSTSGLCKMLWKRMEFLHHHLISQIVNSNLDLGECANTKGEKLLQNEKVSRTTQTTLCSLTYCESCHLSIAMIKLLVQTIDSQSSKYNIKDTNVSRVRRQMHQEVFNLSEWGAMRCWIDAICSDISTAAKALLLSQNQNRKMQEDMKLHHSKTRTDWKANKSKILKLESAVNDNNRRFAEEQLQINQLKKENEELTKQLKIKENDRLKLEEEKFECQKKLQNTNNRLLEAEKKLQEKNTELQLKDVQLNDMEAELGRKILNLESALKITEANLATVDMQLDVYKMEADISKEKKAELLRETEGLKKQLDKAERMFERERETKKEIEEKLNETLKDFRSVQNEKTKHTDEMKTLQVKFETAMTELKQSKQNEQLLLHHPESSAVPQFKLKGDPLIDMEAQRRANKIRIKHMLQENEMLKSTISKLSRNSSS